MFLFLHLVCLNFTLPNITLLTFEICLYLFGVFGPTNFASYLALNYFMYLSTNNVW